VAALLPPATRRAEPESTRAGLVAAGLAVAGFAVAVGLAAATHPGIVVRIHVQTKLVVVFTTLAAIALAVAAGYALLLQAMALRSASTTRS
jgi:hypothetical protein